MAKRPSSQHSNAPETKRRRVNFETFRKWQRECDKDYQTLIWLSCQTDMDGGKVVDKLTCTACQKFEDKTRGRKNYRDKWIVGADRHLIYVTYTNDNAGKTFVHYIAEYRKRELVDDV